MSYEVRIQGGLPNASGSEAELQHVKEALAQMYSDLQDDRGHVMTTAFINDQPFNFQVEKERSRALQEAQDYYATSSKEPHLDSQGNPLHSDGKSTDEPLPTSQTPDDATHGKVEFPPEPAPVSVPLSSEGKAPPTLTTPQIPGKEPEPAKEPTAGGPPAGARPAGTDQGQNPSPPPKGPDTPK